MSLKNITNGSQSGYDRINELKAFDATKSGVKGIVDYGIKSLPKMFIRPDDELLEDSNIPCVELEVPEINLEDISNKNRYDEIVKQVLGASEKWGFFQVVNHGIPQKVLNEMMHGIRMFHEQDAEAKKELYGRNSKKQVEFNSNIDLYTSRAANWRDTLVVTNLYSSGQLDPKELPQLCRDAILDYINHVLKLGDILLELISVALGLRPDYLKEMECSKGWSMVNHYYPACPAPELTLGAGKHADASFLTILLQDQIGGLQVFHENQWVNVQPIPGALVVNIGDVLQLTSNDKLKSVYHRVTTNTVGPRISVAFFLRGVLSSSKLYGPIKELLSEENPPIYRDFTLSEFYSYFFSRPNDELKCDHFKVQNHGDAN